jgi:hypothetical protein
VGQGVEEKGKGRPNIITPGFSILPRSFARFSFLVSRLSQGGVNKIFPKLTQLLPPRMRHVICNPQGETTEATCGGLTQHTRHKYNQKGDACLEMGRGRCQRQCIQSWTKRQKQAASAWASHGPWFALSKMCGYSVAGTACLRGFWKWGGGAAKPRQGKGGHVFFCCPRLPAYVVPPFWSSQDQIGPFLPDELRPHRHCASAK